ncbi:MAG: hypothetical protein RBU25_07860 [Lentisphaeria bacterium]|jgi:hypothetical protein|nr:hypothetical protein [Lentisphaeria bacterium]
MDLPAPLSLVRGSRQSQCGDRIRTRTVGRAFLGLLLALAARATAEGSFEIGLFRQQNPARHYAELCVELPGATQVRMQKTGTSEWTSFEEDNGEFELQTEDAATLAELNAIIGGDWTLEIIHAEGTSTYTFAARAAVEDDFPPIPVLDAVPPTISGTHEFSWTWDGTADRKFFEAELYGVHDYDSITWTAGDPDFPDTSYLMNFAGQGGNGDVMIVYERVLTDLATNWQLASGQDVLPAPPEQFAAAEDFALVQVEAGGGGLSIEEVFVGWLAETFGGGFAGYWFTFELEAAGVVSARFQAPGGTWHSLVCDGPDEWEYEQGATTLAGIETPFPAGSYLLEITHAGGVLETTIEATALDMPACAPRITAPFHGQSDAATPGTTLTWERVGTADYAITVVEAEDAWSGAEIANEFLGADAAEFPLAGLAANRVYEAKVILANGEPDKETAEGVPYSVAKLRQDKVRFGTSANPAALLAGIAKVGIRRGYDEEPDLFNFELELTCTGPVWAEGGEPLFAEVWLHPPNDQVHLLLYEAGTDGLLGDTLRHRWSRATLDELRGEWPDGWYLLELRDAAGGGVVTPFWFGTPGTADPLPLPVQQPAITAPAANATLPGPVDFAWDAVTDGLVDTLLFQVLAGETPVVAKFLPPAATAFGPQALDPGDYEAVLALVNVHPGLANADGVAYDVATYRSVLVPFAVGDPAPGFFKFMLYRQENPDFFYAEIFVELGGATQARIERAESPGWLYFERDGDQFELTVGEAGSLAGMNALLAGHWTLEITHGGGTSTYTFAVRDAADADYPAMPVFTPVPDPVADAHTFAWTWNGTADRKVFEAELTDGPDYGYHVWYAADPGFADKTFDLDFADATGEGEAIIFYENFLANLLSGWQLAGGPAVLPPVPDQSASAEDVVLFQVGEPPAFGAVQVTIEPEAVRDAARWRIDGGDWQTSGTTVGNLVPEVITIDFLPVDGWLAPAAFNVVIAAGETATPTGTYQLLTGAWQITISAPGPFPAPVVFGMAEEATDGWDDGLDAGATLPGPDQAGIYFQHLSLNYGTDLRAVADAATVTEWLLVAKAHATQNLELTWELPPTFPANAYLTMYELEPVPGRYSEWVPTGDTAIDMAQIWTNVVPAGQLRVWRLRFGPDLIADLRLEKGWNLKALPIQPHDPAIASVLADPEGSRGTVHAGTVWGWQNGNYAELTTLDALTVGWIYADNPVVLMVPGLPVPFTQLELVAGWNMVAVPRTLPVPADTSLRGPCWRWQAWNLRYEPVTTFEPFFGHWLNSVAPILLPVQ